MGWWLGSKGKSGEGVHDQVDPEHLYSVQWRFLGHDGTQEDNEHSDKVDGELELQEFSNIIVDISSVLKSNNNGGEVIIEKDDIAGALGDVSTSDTHSETDISLSQSWSIVGTITSYSNNTITVLNTSDQKIFILGG